jgi:hypothetical protein
MSHLSRLRAFGVSAALFLWGVLKRLYYLIPTLFFDPFDFIDKLKPSLPSWAQTLVGKVTMPSEYFPYVLLGCTAYIAILTYHELRRDKIKVEKEKSDLEDRFKPKLKILFEDKFVELTHYQHLSFRGIKYCRVARIAVQNSGDDTAYNVRVALRDFSLGHVSYDGITLYPKDDFNEHSNGVFSLDPKEKKYIDVALRQDVGFTEAEAGTYLRIVAPAYLNKNIGNCEIRGLKIQVTAREHKEVEKRFDLYLEKVPLTNQAGEQVFHKRLKFRASSVAKDAPTEVSVYQDDVTPPIP